MLFVAVTFSASAQSPEQISYQAVIRDNNSDLVTNSDVSIRILIRQGSITGTTAYQEEHNTTTNTNGLVSLIIGKGTPISGDFNDILWSQDSHFIETQVDIEGGTNFDVIGTSQLLSVPYALHSKTAERFSGPNPYRANIISFDLSRDINSADINNTIACTSSATLTLTADFVEMQVGDILNLEAHNGAVLTIISASGVTLNYTDAGSAEFNSNAGNVRFGLIRKSGPNAYIISGQ